MKNNYLFSEVDGSVKESSGKNACETREAVPGSHGFVLAQERIAWYVSKANGCVDKSQAAEYYFKAAILGDEDSVIKYAGLTSYIFDDTDTKTAGKACKELKKVMKKYEKLKASPEKVEVLFGNLCAIGMPYAYYRIGYAYFLDGQRENAEKFLTIAADNGDMKAAHLLVDFYRRTFEETRNEKTVRYTFDFEKAVRYIFLQLAWRKSEWYEPNDFSKADTTYFSKYSFVEPAKQGVRDIRELFGGLSTKSNKTTPGMRFKYFGDFLPDDELNLAIYNWCTETKFGCEPEESVFKILKNETDNGIPLNSRKKPMKNIKRFALDEETFYEGEVSASGLPDGTGTWSRLISRYREDIYYGDFTNGVFNGKGVLKLYTKRERTKEKFYNNDCYTCYDGIWKDGKRQDYFNVYVQTLGGLTESSEEKYFIDDEEIQRSSISLDSIPDWQSVKSGEYQAKREEERADKERAENIEKLMNLICNPEQFADVNDRNIEKSCEYLAPFINEAEALFDENNVTKAMSILEQIIGKEDDNFVECLYNTDGVFNGFVYKALMSIADEVDFFQDDFERIFSAVANIACYFWKFYQDRTLLDAVIALLKNADMAGSPETLWFMRVIYCGNPRVESDRASEMFYGELLNQNVLMGSNGKLYRPDRPWETVRV